MELCPVKVDQYYLVIVTAFDHQIGEKTEVNFDRVLATVPRYDHTLSLNIIIMNIQSNTERMLIL